MLARELAEKLLAKPESPVIYWDGGQSPKEVEYVYEMGELLVLFHSKLIPVSDQDTPMRQAVRTIEGRRSFKMLSDGQKMAWREFVSNAMPDDATEYELVQGVYEKFAEIMKEEC